MIFTLYFFILLPVPAVVGFSERSYTVSESEGTATVTVEILEGTVADEDITVQFSTQDSTALRRFFLNALVHSNTHVSKGLQH